MIKKTNEERDADRKREAQVLSEVMLTRTADEWEAFLQARHVPAARVRTMGEAMADPQLTSRGIIHHHAGGNGIDGGFGSACGLYLCARWPTYRRAAACTRPAQRRDFQRAWRYLMITFLRAGFLMSADYLVSSRSMSAAYSSGDVGNGSAPSVCNVSVHFWITERRAQRGI